MGSSLKFKVRKRNHGNKAVPKYSQPPKAIKISRKVSNATMAIQAVDEANDMDNVDGELDESSLMSM